MAKDLTTCQVDRQNILNNELAITELQKQTGIQGVVFEERLRFTKAMVATYFDVDERTIAVSYTHLTLPTNREV